MSHVAEYRECCQELPHPQHEREKNMMKRRRRKRSGERERREGGNRYTGSVVLQETDVGEREGSEIKACVGLHGRILLTTQNVVRLAERMVGALPER